MSRREEWEVIQTDGRRHFLLRQGVLRRGLPMAVVTVLVIQALEGSLDRDLLHSVRFYLRFLAALAVFSLGGVASAYAHWRTLEKRFGRDPLQPRVGVRSRHD